MNVRYFITLRCCGRHRTRVHYFHRLGNVQDEKQREHRRRLKRIHFRFIRRQRCHSFGRAQQSLCHHVWTTFGPRARGMLSGSGDISSLLHFNSSSQLSTVHALLCRSRFHNAGNLLSIHFTSQTNRKPCSLGTCLAPNSTQSPSPQSPYSTWHGDRRRSH